MVEKALESGQSIFHLFLQKPSLLHQHVSSCRFFEFSQQQEQAGDEGDGGENGVLPSSFSVGSPWAD